MSGSPEEARKHVDIYMKVAGALAVLTVVTVLASYIEVAVPLAIVIALIIATAKGSLVVSYFMHLIEERSPTLALSLILTAVFWLVLMLVPIFTVSDTYGVHKPLPNANAAHAGDEAH